MRLWSKNKQVPERIQYPDFPVVSNFFFQHACLHTVSCDCGLNAYVPCTGEFECNCGRKYQGLWTLRRKQDGTYEIFTRVRLIRYDNYNRVLIVEKEFDGESMDPSL